MIPLFVENEEAVVWNDIDWSILRNKYRICGALIGSTSSVPKKNDSGQIILMYEEALLLLANEICALFKIPRISNVLNMDVQDPKEIAKNMLAQKETILKSRLDEVTQRFKIITASKTRRLLSSDDADKEDKQTILKGQIKEMTLLPPERNPDTDKFKVSIEALDHEYGVPRASHFTAFTDLWEMGFYVMSGSKFGSDYVLYPGDPHESQAMYMVWCVEDEKTSFSPTKNITLESLSVAGNKTGLITYSDGSGVIQYQSVNRQG